MIYQRGQIWLGASHLFKVYLAPTLLFSRTTGHFSCPLQELAKSQIKQNQLKTQQQRGAPNCET